jgi:hypothetical protein
MSEKVKYGRKRSWPNLKYCPGTGGTEENNEKKLRTAGLQADTKTRTCRVRHSVLYTGITGGKINILGGHSNGHSKQESVYVHMSYFKVVDKKDIQGYYK